MFCSSSQSSYSNPSTLVECTSTTSGSPRSMVPPAALGEWAPTSRIRDVYGAGVARGIQTDGIHRNWSVYTRPALFNVFCVGRQKKLDYFANGYCNAEAFATARPTGFPPGSTCDLVRGRRPPSALAFGAASRIAGDHGAVSYGTLWKAANFTKLLATTAAKSSTSRQHPTQQQQCNRSR